MKIAVFHNLPAGGAKRRLFETLRLLSRHHGLEIFQLESADNKFCDVSSFGKCHDYEYSRHLAEAAHRFMVNPALKLYDLRSLRKVNSVIAAGINGSGFDAAFINPCRYMKAPFLLGFLNIPTVYYCDEPHRRFYEPQIPREYANKSTRQRLGALIYDRIDDFYRRFDAGNIRHADIVLTNSKYTASRIRECYSVNAHVNYLGVDSKFFSPSGEKRGNFVLSVGGISPAKGHDFVIESVAAIPPGRRPEVRIAAGGGNKDERNYLEALASRKDLGLHFHDSPSDEELLRLYRTASATVYTPVREPFGLVPLESMACETPVVGIAEGGVTESIVDGETGFLAPREPAECARAISRLLEDEDLRIKMGRRARQYVCEHWTWEKSVSELEQHLELALSARR